MPLVRVGDIELNYELVDCTEPWKATRPPLVFLHGLGGNNRLFLFQVPEFCRKFPVITIDLRGHGESSQPAADWTMADTALDVVRLLRLLGVERAHMVGRVAGRHGRAAVRPRLSVRDGFARCRRHAVRPAGRVRGADARRRCATSKRSRWRRSPSRASPTPSPTRSIR